MLPTLHAPGDAARGRSVERDLHSHTLVLQEVFRKSAAAALVFHAAPAPSDAEVVATLTTIPHLRVALTNRFDALDAQVTR
jgi:hypothetical protein